MLILYFFIVTLGLLMGSFLYTTALRLQSSESLLTRSHCDHCQQKITILGLVPIIGYLAYKGRCPSCQSPISKLYPISEIANAILTLLIFWRVSEIADFFHAWILFETLFLIALLDLKTYVIYPQPVLFGLTVQTLWLVLWNQHALFDRLIGLGVGAGIFHWVAYLYQTLRGRVGLGEGDATLLGLMGYFFGWKILFPTIFWSAFLGILGGGLLLLLQKRALNREIAFGPWLVIALFMGWLFPSYFGQLPTALLS